MSLQSQVGDNEPTIPIKQVRLDLKSGHAHLQQFCCVNIGSSTLASPARWTFDMGLEISGHVRLSLPAGIPPNTNFTLRHAEALSHPPLPIQKGSVTTKEISKYVSQFEF